jgi:hypothetical protein
MPVLIDEVTTEIAPPDISEEGKEAASGGPKPLPLRRLRSELAMLAQRDARLHAD